MKSFARQGRRHGSLLRATMLLAFGAPVVAALAQVPPTPTVPPGVTDYQDMLAQYEATQAAAHRPGDEVLACDAIRTELEATVNSPAMQDYITSASEQAQRDMEYMQQAQAELVGVTPGVPATTVPPVPAADPAVQAAERVQAHQQQVEKLTAVMPLLMRAQRLSELAALKACDWLSEGGYSLPSPEPSVPLQ